MDRSKNTLGMLATTLLAAAGTVAPMLALAASSSVTLAQSTDVDPYYVVVNESNVNLRCGAGLVWYPVGKLNQNQVLRVDGHEFGWLRVGYPSGTAAIVRANDAEFDPTASTVTLIRESKLQASNIEGGASESWRQLLDASLPADTVLQHLETLRSTSGEITAYRVVAPGGARGFVSETLVRMANENEVQAFLAMPQDAPKLANAAGDNTPTEAVAAKTAESLANEVAEAALAEAPTPDDNDGLQGYNEDTVEVVIDEPDAALEVETTVVNRFPPPAADAPVEERPAPTIVSQPISAGGQSSTTPTPPAQTPVASYPELNRTFEEVMRQPTEGAEYAPLINEFQRLIETLPDEPGSDSMRAAANGRIAALRLRADLQESMQRMNAALATADVESVRVQESALTLDANPIYRFVGRLSSSMVYNGQRLPLLFRVQAVDSGRTIAYLTPSPELDLAAKLNTVVGVVVAQSRDDSTLGLPLIDAKRVDIIRAEMPDQ
jgi:uncharacterized protein YgiM (DUF1202 family)